jgi:hypothetical protein
MALASVGYAQTFTSGEKGKVKGTILSRSGDLVKVQDKKTGSPVVIKITDDTKILRDKNKVAFRRHEDMDVTAMVPGLTVSEQGISRKLVETFMLASVTGLARCVALWPSRNAQRICTCLRLVCEELM